MHVTMRLPSKSLAQKIGAADTCITNEGMDQVISNHTWLVHLLSSLRLPLSHSSIESYQIDASRFLRQSPEAHKRLVGDPESIFVTIRRFSADLQDQIKFKISCDNISKDGGGFKRSLRSSLCPEADELTHWHIEVRINEKWSSDVLFLYGLPASCYVTSFSYCMVRGSNTYEAVFRWMESLSNCTIDRKPWQPTSAEMVMAVASWTRQIYEKHHPSATKLLSGARKPLALTFATPPDIKALETLSISIPPIALFQLYESIERNSPETGVSPPLYKALTLFMKESFGINVQSFPVVKASCGAGSLGNDGRCKIAEQSYIYHFLSDIRDIIRKKHLKPPIHTEFESEDELLVG